MSPACLASNHFDIKWLTQLHSNQEETAFPYAEIQCPLLSCFKLEPMVTFREAAALHCRDH